MMTHATLTHGIRANLDQFLHQLLQVTNKNEFVKLLTSEIPPRPAEMDRMVAANIADWTEARGAGQGMA